MGSALVRVCRNIQHRELKLPKSTRYALMTAVMAAVPTGCLVSPPPPFSQMFVSLVCMCVCSFFPFILDVRLVDIPVGATQDFLITLPSAVLAPIFLARRTQPFLSLVDRKIEFCVLTISIVFHLLGIYNFFS